MPSIAAAANEPFARGIDPIGAKLGVGWESFLTVEGGRTPPAGSFQLALAADYAAGLMSLRQGDEKLGDLIQRRLDLHLLGSVALTDWAELGLDVPLTVYQAHGFDLLQRHADFADRHPDSVGSGDARLLAKVRLLAAERAPVGIALLAEVRLPTGADQSFLGERGVLIAPRAVIERSFGDAFRLGLEGGYRFRQDAGQYLNLYVGDELTLALAGSYALPASLPWTRWTAYAEVLTATPSRAPFTSAGADSLKTPLEALLGLRAGLGDGLHALIGGGTGIAGESGFGRESLRLFASVGYRQVGVPYVPRDSDGDGVEDREDRCPLEPGPAELDGCPDTDGDGIPDIEDDCPDEPGPALKNGCPAEDPLVVFEDGAISLRGAINFDTAKADIHPDSFHVLDQVAAMLLSHPEVGKVRVEGHTDSLGSAQLNRTLSQRRAVSVVQYLIRKGVPRERLEAAGYGPERPVASNLTPLGRAKNRRVEFTILPQEE